MAASGKRCGAHPVVPLVEEVAGLLPADDISAEFEPVLDERNLVGRGRAGQHAPVGNAVGVTATDVAAVAQHHPGGAGELDEEGNDGRQMRQPGVGVGLHDERVGIAVDDESGNAVVLAVYEAIPGRRHETG